MLKSCLTNIYSWRWPSNWEFLWLKIYKNGKNEMYLYFLNQLMKESWIYSDFQGTFKVYWVLNCFGMMGCKYCLQQTSTIWNIPPDMSDNVLMFVLRHSQTWDTSNNALLHSRHQQFLTLHTPSEQIKITISKYQNKSTWEWWWSWEWWCSW